MIRKNEHTNPKKERTGDRGQPTLEHQVYYRIDQRTTLRQRDPARWPRAREANTDLITVNAYNPTSAQGYPDRSRWPTSPKRDPGPQGPDFCSMKVPPAVVRSPVAGIPLKYPSLTHRDGAVADIAYPPPP